jgi:hypothetical protein
VHVADVQAGRERRRHRLADIDLVAGDAAGHADGRDAVDCLRSERRRAGERDGRRAVDDLQSAKQRGCDDRAGVRRAGGGRCDARSEEPAPFGGIASLQRRSPRRR